MDIITLDFETYYDSGFSLSKVTTEQYIRDSRFEVIGVAIKHNDGPAQWYAGEAVADALGAIDFGNKAVLCHNTAFDGAILSWRYGIRPRFWLDTLSMARPFHALTVGGSLKALAEHYGLGQKGTEVVNAMGKRLADFSPGELSAYGRYCVNDVELTRKLFDKLRRGFPVGELLAIDLTLRMFTEPVFELDRTLLQSHLDKVTNRRAELLASLGEQAEEVIMSNQKFAAFLTRLGVEPPMKTSPTTGKPTFAFAKTDKGMQALLEHPDLRVQLAASVRLGAKSTLEATRTTNLLGVAARGRLPIMLNYYGTHTGRFSGGDRMNLQNLPSRGDTTIRRALRAPDGYVVIACDSSQIEARTLAWLAGQTDLVEAFRQKRDVYSEFATRVYQRPVTKADRIERHVGKTCILGLGYGMGAEKLQRTLELGAGGVTVKMDLPEVERIVAIYRRDNFRIAQFWDRCRQALGAIVTGRHGELHPVVTHDAHGIRLPNGFYLRYPELRQVGQGSYEYIGDPRQMRKFRAGEEVSWSHIYGGKVTENCIAAGTEVLTNRGWVPIENVQSADMVHDGVEFVRHGGTVFKSVQDCITIDGVWMTPDHEVLTNAGWQAASQNPEPYRPNLRHVDRYQSRTQRWEETVLAVPLPVRGAMREGWQRSNQGGQTRRDTELRMYDQTTNLQGQRQARYVQAPGLRRLAVYAGSVYASVSQSVAELRRTWHNGLRSLVRVFRELLGGHGTDVPAWVGPQPQGQRRPLQPRELRVDHAQDQHHEQAQHRAQSGCTGAQCADWDTQINPVLPTQARPVFDILNAGPRQRFVVRGDNGPFIVHNCVQALAALIIREQMVELSHVCPVARIVLQVHDEVVVVAPEDEAERVRATLEHVMSTPPVWCSDLPLACESGIADNYGDT